MMRQLALRLLAFLILLSSLMVARAQDDCAAARLPRLTVGGAALVSFTDGSPLNIRDAASRSGNVLAQIPEGSPFTVLEGPSCADGIYWWRIQAEGAAGWIAESVDGVYLVEPVFLPASQLETGSILVFAGVDTLIFTDHNLAVIQEVSLPDASHFRASSNQVYFMAEGHLNAVDSAGTVRAVPTPDLMATADYWPSPDGSQIAWLLVTETGITAAQDANCEQGIRCVDRDYVLMLTDTNGDNAREVWTTRIEDRNNGLYLELHGWRDDLKAVYLFRNPRTPSGTYPVTGDAVYEVLVDSSGSVNALVDRYLEMSEVAVSADGLWLAQEQSQPFTYLPLVESSVIGLNHIIDAPAITGDNLSTTSHQYIFSPDGQYFLWVELASNLNAAYSGATTIRRLTLVEGTVATLAQFAESSPPTMPVAGPWLTDTLLVWYYDEGIHVMDITTGQTAGFYPQVAPMQVGQVVGLLRP